MFGLCYLTDTNCLDFIRLYRKGNLAVFDFNRLAVGLFQTVAAFCRMEGKVPVQGDICQAVLALIHTHNGTIAILGAFDGFQHHIGCIQSGKADIGMAGLTVTEDRKVAVDFSDSYATGVQVVIVKDDSPITSVDDLFADGASTVVGTQAGTTGFIYATSDIEDAGLGTVKSFGKTTDAVEALKNGQVDCVILDNEPAKALVCLLYTSPSPRDS